MNLTREVFKELTEIIPHTRDCTCIRDVINDIIDRNCVVTDHITINHVRIVPPLANGVDLSSSTVFGMLIEIRRVARNFFLGADLQLRDSFA